MEKILKSPPAELSEILTAKAIRRQALATLSWEEKVSIIVKMKQLLPKGQWKELDSRERNEVQKNGGTRQPIG